MSGRTLRVYVAAPFEDAGIVRETHVELRRLGMVPTSNWAVSASPGKEVALGAEAMRSFAAANDADLLSSDAVLVLARDGVGGEMFAEARLAVAHRIPVVWMGRRILTSYRKGVAFVPHFVDAVLELQGLDAAMCVGPK